MTDVSENFKNLQNDIHQFEDVIRNLSMGVNNCGVSWRDPKYKQLTGKISTIATSSKSVIQVGQRCESAMKRFESIASEV